MARWLHDLSTDLRFGIRTLIRHRRFSIIVVLTLTLGIGANVAVYSLVNAVILRPLPFVRPDRLVAIWEADEKKGWVNQLAAPANVLAWQDRVPAFADLAGWSAFEETAILSGVERPVSLRSMAVTGNFFAILGARAAVGRLFAPHETWQGVPTGVVLSHGTWRDHFGGDSAVVGRTITLNGNDEVIVGVAPEGFGFPSRDVSLWTTMRWDPADREQPWFRLGHFVRPIARLRDGVDLEQARVELKAVMQALALSHPASNASATAGLSGLQEFVIGNSRQSLLVLLAGTGLLLLITCANVGNLLLVRAHARQREVALRRALGATHDRIARQAFAEAILFTGLGGIGGIVTGFWGIRILLAVLPTGLLPVTEVGPDFRLLVVSIIACAITAFALGLAPAIWSARHAPAEALKASSSATTSAPTWRSWSSAFAVGEVALAVTLTVAAVLLVRSLSLIQRVNPGFEPSGLSVYSLVLPQRPYDSGPKLSVFYDQLLPAISALPGVTGAALVSGLPLSGAAGSADISIRSGFEVTTGREVRRREVSPEYFRVMGVPVTSGRGFQVEDRGALEPVVVVNRAFVERVFGRRDPTGAMLAFGLRPDSTTRWYRIVGVVGDERSRSLRDAPSPEVIQVLRQERARGVNVVVRSTVDPAAMLLAFERALRGIDPNLAPSRATTMNGIRDQNLASDRFMAGLVAVFALIGLTVAMVGVFGVVAQTVARRMHEMGIRLALGADPLDVYGLILGYGLRLTLTGVALGLAVAALFGGTMKSLLFAVNPLDPTTFVLVAGGLALAGLVAAWIPARRIGRGTAIAGILR